MSEETEKSLNKVISDLQNRLNESQNMSNEHLVKLDGMSGLFGDVINNNLEVRSNLIRTSKALNEANQKLNSSQQFIAALNNQLSAATAKLKELEAKFLSLSPPPKAELELIEADKEQKSA